MTNAEKYLKDGVDVNNFVGEFNDFCAMQTSNQASSVRLAQFLSRTFKPTLTEDEKVIIRNIGEDCISLMRSGGSLYFHTEGKGIFPDLFKFIKERRRIRDKGVAKR